MPDLTPEMLDAMLNELIDSRHGRRGINVDGYNARIAERQQAQRAYVNEDCVPTGDYSHGRKVYLDRSANKFVFLDDNSRWYHIDDEELPDSHNGVRYDREWMESPIARGSTVAQYDVVDVAQNNNPYITLSSTPIGIATRSVNTGEWVAVEPYSRQDYFESNDIVPF